MEKLGKYVKHNESALISNAWRHLMATNLESFPITVLLIAKETVLSPDQRKQTLE